MIMIMIMIINIIIIIIGEAPDKTDDRSRFHMQNQRAVMEPQKH